VKGGTYCHQGCDGPPTISVANSSGLAFVFDNVCQTDCRTCELTQCPPGPCYQDSTVAGATLNWDGSYYGAWTCGSGTSCLEPTFAPPGRYTATYCATPGTLHKPDGGAAQCVVSGPEKCTSVDFDFPSMTVVKGAVGP
jgi:hypothetical protein